MAPEQARGQLADKSADVWAPGVILYEMLTGEQMPEGQRLFHMFCQGHARYVPSGHLVFAREEGWGRLLDLRIWSAYYPS